MHIQFSKVFYALACVGAVSCAPLLGENDLNARAPVPVATTTTLTQPTPTAGVRLNPNLINTIPENIANINHDIVVAGGGDRINPVASDREYGYGPIHFGYPKDEVLVDTIKTHPELVDLLGVKGVANGVNVAGLTPRGEGEE